MNTNMLTMADSLPHKLVGTAHRAITNPTIQNITSFWGNAATCTNMTTQQRLKVGMILARLRKTHYAD